MKVFFDTNVLISAFTARGLCADLMRIVLAEHELQTGAVNLTELRRVLRDRFKAPASNIDVVEALLRDHTIVPKPKVVPAIRIRDADDAWVLASAIAGEADMLVSGDQDLLSVAKSSPVPILSPREAWERLRGEPERAA